MMSVSLMRIPAVMYSMSTVLWGHWHPVHPLYAEHSDGGLYAIQMKTENYYVKQKKKKPTAGWRQPRGKVVKCQGSWVLLSPEMLKQNLLAAL